MDIIFTVLSLISTGLGLFLLLDFLFWRLRGKVTSAVITGFQARKSKSSLLPEVVFKTEEGEEIKSNTKRIDQFLYLFNYPDIGDPTTVIYQVKHPKKTRIYGYINVVGGLFLLFPLFIYVGFKLSSSEMVVQLFYSLVFIGIILGGWMLLKLIQRYY